MAESANAKQKSAISNETDKNKALKMALDTIRKSYGEGSIMRMGENSALDIEGVPTGSLALDVALGIGGVPCGRITEIFGPESSGKTTVALHIVAEVQKRGGTAAYIDAENALDPKYAKALGVDVDNLLISQPDTGEQGLEICDMLARSAAVDIMVIDSVAALVPRAEIEGDMGDSHMGLHARLMSQALRKLAGVINRSNMVVIFINQLRSNIGGYGPLEVTTGGKALKFYASVRIDVRRKDYIKEGDNVLANVTEAKVVKNKVAPPFKTARFDIIYGKGISKESGLLDVAEKTGVIQKAGAWFSYEGSKIGQGRDTSKKWLSDNPDKAQEIEGKIRNMLKGGNITAIEEESEEIPELVEA